jgi:hypothetical protein
MTVGDGSKECTHIDPARVIRNSDSVYKIEIARGPAALMNEGCGFSCGKMLLRMRALEPA